jgi:hypothetical protein
MYQLKSCWWWEIWRGWELIYLTISHIGGTFQSLTTWLSSARYALLTHTCANAPNFRWRSIETNVTQNKKVDVWHMNPAQAEEKPVQKCGAKLSGKVIIWHTDSLKRTVAFTAVLAAAIIQNDMRWWFGTVKWKEMQRERSQIVRWHRGSRRYELGRSTHDKTAYVPAKSWTSHLTSYTTRP